MKRLITALCITCVLAFGFSFAAFAVSADEPAPTAPIEFEETLVGGDVLDANVETLNFDDLYLSSMTTFDSSNSDKSMFGGFLKTGRIVSSFEISYDVTVLEAPDANSVLGFGIKNVVSDAKQNIIKSGGYEILIGKNSRINDVATSLSTISVIKNNALDNTGSSSVAKKAVSSIDLNLAEGAEFNIKIGAIRILNGDETKGYKIYVKATKDSNTATLIEVIDYCDINENIGGYASGVITGAGKYKIETKNSDNCTTLEAVKSYDILQLDEGTKSYYEANVDNKSMFGDAKVITDSSVEVNMKVIVETPVNGWSQFMVGLKTCVSGVNFNAMHGGYAFVIGNQTHGNGGNNYKTLSIARNGLFNGSAWPNLSVKIVAMPDWFASIFTTKGSAFKYTVGLRRIMDGDTFKGYYGYMKANDVLLLDFYDYFDWDGTSDAGITNSDYFGEILSGLVNYAGAYTITTCGETDKSYEEKKDYDLSELVPVTAEGLTYKGEKASAEEKVIGRYLTNEESIGISYKFKYTGSPKMDLSLKGLDDAEKADAVRFSLDIKEKTFRVYTVDTKETSFDSGELDFAAVGLTLAENTEYDISYGVVRYKYGDVGKYNRAKVFFSVNGVTLYEYHVDYIGASTLGYYVGGRIIGEETDSVTIIPKKDNQLSVTITAKTLKESIKAGEKNAVSYESSAPFGLSTVEYVITSGEDVATVNEYGVISGLKEGVAKIKVKITTQYGVYESNEAEVNVLAAEESEDTLKSQADEFALGCSGGCNGSVADGTLVLLPVLAIIAAIIVLKKKRS